MQRELAPVPPGSPCKAMGRCGTVPQAMEGLRWDANQEISYKAHSDC